MDAFTRAVVSSPGSQRLARTPFGAPVVIHATAAQTGGAFGMWETFTPPGKGPLPHTHMESTEVFRVIRGTYRFVCGDDEFDAPPGTVVTLPPGIRHAWRNVSDEPGQMFGIVTPGGFEQMFIDIEREGATTPDAIALIQARYGVVNDATAALGAAT